MILISNSVNTYAQTDSCGTPDADTTFVTTLPWYGNNVFLTNLRDSLHNANNCNNCKLDYVGGVGNYIYQIPVRVILYYDATHRAFDDDEVQWYINAVNNIYRENGFRVHLYLDNCNIHRKSSNIFTYAGNWAQMMSTALNLERESNKLNITLVYGWQTGNGIGPYPWLQDKYGSVVIANGIGFSNNIASSIAHEVGHTLGLLHTFHRNGCRNDCWQECVSRIRTQENKCLFTAGKLKCSVNGDLLCDTDADPSDLDGVEWDCNSYTIIDIEDANAACAITDNYGDFWLQPPFNNALNNLMTYQHFINVVCNQITPMQQGVMYHFISKSNSSMKYNAEVDFFENDNFYQRSPFNFGSFTNIFLPNSIKQYHTFHHSKGTACDVDWVYFQNSTAIAKPYLIQTQEVIGKPKPDTKITLFAINADGTLGAQVATNDNISGTNLFSKITTSNLAAWGTFALRIENNITNINDTRSKGHYYLRIDACYDKTNVAIIGDEKICTSKQYSISNLPAGATVSWSVSPSNLVSITTNGNNATLTKINTNTGVLTATITACGESYIITKNIAVGLPNILSGYYYVNGYQNGLVEFITPTSINTICCNTDYTTNVYITPRNADLVEWEQISGGVFFWGQTGILGYDLALFPRTCNKTGVFRINLSNECGSVYKDFKFYANIQCSPASTGMKTSSVPCENFDVITKNSLISIKQNDNDCISPLKIQNISIIDKSGNVVRELLTPNSSQTVFEFNLIDIKNDIYFINIQYNDRIETHQIALFR